MVTEMTKQEREVLVLIAEGYSTKEISVKMRLAEGTVETYRKRMMTKVKAKNAPHLVAIALKSKMI